MGVGAVCALALVWSQIESARGNRMDAKPMRFDQYEHQYTGGPADVPDECRAQEETGSPDDMYCRVKATERAIPEEPSGFQDARPIGDSGYDMYGYGG